MATMLSMGVMGLVGLLVMVGVGLVFKHFREQALKQKKIDEEWQLIITHGFDNRM